MMQEPQEFVSTAEITERSHTRVYRQHKSNLKQKKPQNSHCLRNCLRFCFKKQTKMAQTGGAPVDPQTELTSSTAAEGGLRELISTWFIQTQASLISHHGLLPNWFLGFISRKAAEDILNDKQLGCFLIRLSDKAIGYILSYRGRDRCRHFVINQNESGQFVVYGDSVGHDTVSDLIEYFKEKPIEPFREYLTTSCFGVQIEDLYDAIQVSPKDRPVATVQALKVKKQISHGSDRVHQGTRRKIRAEEVPALPRRSRLLDGASASENPDTVCYAQVRTKKPRERQVNGAAPENSSRPPSVYSEVELRDSRSRSMPLLLSSSEEQNYRLSVTPPLPSRDTPSPEPPLRGPCSGPSPGSSPGRPLCALSQEMYHPEPRAEETGVYVEVPGEHCPPVDDTYEPIPGDRDSNPYEPVGLLRPSARGGAKNDKWKRLFPEMKKKR